jgi:hypothetical protein
MRVRTGTLALFLALFLALAGCGGYGGARFSGPVLPQGTGAACGSATRGVLVLGEKDFTFAPNEGVVVLHGTVQHTGDDSAKLHGSYQTTGADKKPYAESFDGTLKDDAISGTWTKPGCTASVALKAD